MCLNVCLQFWGSGEQAQPQGIFFIFLRGREGGVDPKKNPGFFGRELKRGKEIQSWIVLLQRLEDEEKKRGGGEKLSLPAS